MNGLEGKGDVITSASACRRGRDRETMFFPQRQQHTETKEYAELDFIAPVGAPGRRVHVILMDGRGSIEEHSFLHDKRRPTTGKETTGRYNMSLVRFFLYIWSMVSTLMLWWEQKRQGKAGRWLWQGFCVVTGSGSVGLAV